jgi:hypothetical protein
MTPKRMRIHLWKRNHEPESSQPGVSRQARFEPKYVPLATMRPESSMAAADSRTANSPDRAVGVSHLTAVRRKARMVE